MNYIIIELLKTSIYISIPIVLIHLLKNNFLSKYTSKLNYTFSILITIRMLFISNITIYLPSKLFALQINSPNSSAKNIHYINSEAIHSLDYLNIIFIIWIIGFLYILSKTFYNQFLFLNKIQNLTYEIDDSNIIACLKKEKIKLNIKRNIKVYKVNGLSSPTLINIFNSKILIPNRDYEIKELKWIFRHELTHFKRNDNFLKLILIVSSSIHWFNPLVKILKSYFYEQCELSCDEKVIKNTHTNEVKDYALVLINTLRYRNNLKSTMLYSQFSNDQINLIKRRIEEIMNFKKYKKGLVLTISACAISLCSIISFSVDNESNYSYANESESGKTAPNTKSVTEDELKKNLENVKINDLPEIMEFYQDKKYEDLTQEEIDYALNFLFTGKCKKVNIGSDATFSINYDNLQKNSNI